MGFFEGGRTRLLASVLTKDNPAYVQFYVTARCNLACRQCNVIYANADQEEVSTDDCARIADNLAAIGVSVVLLTGGEPFARKDIVDVAKIFMERGLHPRIQTNGLARREQLEALGAAGIHDVSISLDSLEPDRQNDINGGFDGSWLAAIRAIADINHIFPEETFAALGCVLSPRNLDQISKVIRFATAIGWWVSLVPAHVTSPEEPRNFMTFDPSMRFHPSQYGEVKRVLEEVKSLRNAGLNVYDSDEYLDDIHRFVTGRPIAWRRRNGHVCDSPNLYFAVQPNGDMAVCCDYRLPEPWPVQHPDFPKWYRSERLRDQARAVTSRCTGCMYGSFPEISITSRFFTPMVRRGRFFLLKGKENRLKRLTADQMVEMAREIREGVES